MYLYIHYPVLRECTPRHSATSYYSLSLDNSRAIRGDSCSGGIVPQSRGPRTRKSTEHVRTLLQCADVLGPNSFLASPRFEINHNGF